MRAVTIPQPGGPEALQLAEVADPVPGPGEVLIDVAATAVNRADILQRQGHYPPPPGASAYPGLECSGRVAALGPGVTGLQPGDEVCALLTGGGYAQRVVSPAATVLPIPRGVSLIDAAALPEAAATVWSNLYDEAGLQPGETVLIHGGGSGVGSFAIQLAAARGAHVITTARPGKHARLRELGAAHTIDYTAEDFATAIDRKADVILDIIGAAYLRQNVAALAPGGRLVVIGLQGGQRGEISLGALLAKRGRLIATTLRGRPLAEKASIISAVQAEVWPLIESGQVQPVIQTTLPLDEVAQAHRLIESSVHLGKILLTL